MRYSRVVRDSVLLGTALAAAAAGLTAGKKKNPDDITQTLALPQEPPAVAIGETRRLVFHVSPLSGKGLLAQQTRDAIHAILKENGGVPVVHIRAFVAGSGDVRRVPQIVSQVFAEKKLPLPSVSVVLAGALALDNAQVVLEAVSVSKREVNPAGLTFVAGEPQTEPDASAPVAPLLDRALAKLDAHDALSVTCFVSSLTGAVGLSGRMAAGFPGAAINLVQAQRLPYTASAACQAIERGTQVTAARLAFTGTRLAFPRLDRDLTEAGADPSGIVMTNVYALSSAAARARRPTTAPMTVVPVEGLASLDATLAVDAVAVMTR